MKRLLPVTAAACALLFAGCATATPTQARPTYDVRGTITGPADATGGGPCTITLAGGGDVLGPDTEVTIFYNQPHTSYGKMMPGTPLPGGGCEIAYEVVGAPTFGTKSYYLRFGANTAAVLDPLGAATLGEDIRVDFTVDDIGFLEEQR